MRSGEWYLGYNAYDNHPGCALTFGRRDSGIVCTTMPDTTYDDGEFGEQPLPGEDGVRWGRDYQRTATTTFELGVDGVDALVDRHLVRPSFGGRKLGDFELPEWAPVTGTRESRTMDGVALLRQAWRADGVRRKAGRVAWLRHRAGGRTRRMYGRPREFDVVHRRLQRQGYTPVTARFVALDDRHYDDTESVAELWAYDAFMERPGLPPWLPTVPPYLRPPQKTAGVRNAGDMATYPHITIHGPCASPQVAITGLWTVTLGMTIPRGSYVVIDARPWIRTVVRTTGGSTASVADKLTRSSPRLADMALPPGLWRAALSYTRTTSSTVLGPRVEIRWRHAYASW
ncbi:hypothetical protein ACIQU7_23530 [Streptomyces albidoflavus]